MFLILGEGVLQNKYYQYLLHNIIYSNYIYSKSLVTSYITNYTAMLFNVIIAIYSSIST